MAEVKDKQRNKYQGDEELDGGQSRWSGHRHYGPPRFFAWLLIGIGLIALIERVFNFDVWEKFWPVFLILLGLFLLLGPRGRRGRS